MKATLWLALWIFLNDNGFSLLAQPVIGFGTQYGIRSLSQLHCPTWPQGVGIQAISPVRNSTRCFLRQTDRLFVRAFPSVRGGGITEDDLSPWNQTGKGTGLLLSSEKVPDICEATTVGEDLSATSKFVQHDMPNRGKLSRKLAKKMDKRQAYARKVAAKRLAEKEQRKAKAEEQRIAFERLSPEEKRVIEEAKKQSKLDYLRTRNAFLQERSNRISERGQPLQRVAIDLGYRGLMTEGEQQSLASQLALCQGENKRSILPLDVMVVEWDEDSPEGSALKKWHPENWKRDPHGVFVTAQKIEQLFESDKWQRGECVYLTADSETVLETLDAQKLYIVGGIVDRNRCAGAAKLRAQMLGIPTAQLPIQKFCRLESSAVLTVNHVVSLLMKVSMGQSWEAAIRETIPSRKISQST